MRAISTNSSEATGARQADAAAPAEPAPKQQRFDVYIYRAWCKRCGICVEFCPHDVFDRRKSRSPDEIFPDIARPVDCTGCQQCVLHCPDFAMRVQPVNPSKEA